MVVLLPDRTRADCLTENIIDFNFSNKWAESIGQSMFYALQTGKRAGIVLIQDSPRDYYCIVAPISGV